MKYLQNFFVYVTGAAVVCMPCKVVFPKHTSYGGSAIEHPSIPSWRQDSDETPVKRRHRGSLGPLPEALPTRKLTRPTQNHEPSKGLAHTRKPTLQQGSGSQGAGAQPPPQLLSGQLISNKTLFCLENNCSQSSAAAGCPSQPQPLNKALIM